MAESAQAAQFLPVLAARDDAVRDIFNQQFPELTQQTTTINNRAGWASAAADQASLHGRESVTPADQLPPGGYRPAAGRGSESRARSHGLGVTGSESRARSHGEVGSGPRRGGDAAVAVGYEQPEAELGRVEGDEVPVPLGPPAGRQVFVE